MAEVPLFSIVRQDVTSSSTPDSNVTLTSSGSRLDLEPGLGGPSHLRRWPSTVSAGPIRG